MGTSTPWGMSDRSEKIAPGIVWYSTPSHGGYHLSPGRQQEMPRELTESGSSRRAEGWYEEDCDWCLVVVAFASLFDADKYSQAKECMRNWLPNRYEAYFREALKPEDSYMRRAQLEAKAIIDAQNN